MIKLAGVSYKAECAMQVKDMSIKELSENVYLKVKGIIEEAYNPVSSFEESFHVAPRLRLRLCSLGPPPHWLRMVGGPGVS